MELRAGEQRTLLGELSLSQSSFEVLNLKESKGQLIKGECGINNGIIFFSCDTIV